MSGGGQSFCLWCFSKLITPQAGTAERDPYTCSTLCARKRAAWERAMRTTNDDGSIKDQRANGTMHTTNDDGTINGTMPGTWPPTIRHSTMI